MNALTNTMEKLTSMLIKTDEKLKDMGQMPYGVRKATLAEQRERYKNLTQEELVNLISKHGAEKVNAWLSKFEGEQYG